MYPSNYSRWSNVIPHNRHSAFLATNTFLYCDVFPYIYQLNIKEHTVRRYIKYPIDLVHESSNLAFDPQTKNIFLLQRDREHGPTNLYKINTSCNNDDDNADKFEWIKLNKEIINKTGIGDGEYMNDPICIFTHKQHLYMVSPCMQRAEENLYRHYPLNLYKFNEPTQEFKNVADSPNYGHYEECSKTIIAPQTINNTQPSNINVYIIQAEDGTFKKLRTNNGTICDVSTSYQFKTDIIAITPLRDDIILVFNEIEKQGDTFIDIVDLRTQKRFCSKRSGVQAISYQDYWTVLLEDRIKEERFTFRYIHRFEQQQHLNHSALLNLGSIPTHIKSLISKFYSDEAILLLYRDNLEGLGFIYSTITVNSILDTTDPPQQLTIETADTYF